MRKALDRAEASDRLALIVLGANWCHDSRALAARLYRSPLAETIEANYELVLVDVGFYENGRDVLHEFGVHHYYATPTVLVVDPASERLVNSEDRHQWRNAYNISMADSVAYFEKWPGAESEPEAVSAELEKLYAEIDQYEQQLADRVEAGYGVVGPMLEALKAGDKPEGFDDSWDELASFRGQVPKKVRALREEARDRLAAGEDSIELQYPDLPPLSWESGRQ